MPLDYEQEGLSDIMNFKAYGHGCGEIAGRLSYGDGTHWVFGARLETADSPEE